jgi:hypothetical protein
MSDTPRTHTVASVARLYRISEDKVRNLIRKGELAAVNVAATLCGRPQLRITPQALAEFERRRSAATIPPPKPARRRKQRQIVDYYPG